MLRFLVERAAFRRLWYINFVSSMVGWAVAIALSVHIYQLTGSAIWTAILAATPTVAGMLFGHLAGTLADRADVRRVVQVALMLRVVVLLALFAVAESPTVLVGFVLLQSIVQQIYGPAEQVLITTYVEPEDLAEANGLNSFASNATRIVAPMLGGAAMVWVGFGPTVGAMTVLMAVSALASLRLVPPGRPAAPIAGEKARGHASSHAAPEVEELPGGYLAVLRTIPRARGLVLVQILDAIKEGPLTALYPVLMLGVIGATSAEMGVASSAFAVTAVMAGPLVGLITKRIGFHAPIVLGAGFANALIVVLAVWPSTPMAIIVFLLSGFPFTVSWVGCNTWLLLTVPHTVRGRIVGSTNAINSAVRLATMLAAGVLAEVFGVQWVIGVAALISVLGLVGVHALIRTKRDPDSDDRPLPSRPRP